MNLESSSIWPGFLSGPLVVSVVGHTSPSKNDENKKETNASIPQQPPGLAGILASKKRPAAVRPDVDVDADSSAYSGNSHHPHESSPNTARQSPRNATSPRGDYLFIIIHLFKKKLLE